MSKWLVVAMVLCGCGADPTTGTVRCSGVRQPMVCTCAESCVTTREQVLVVADEACAGAALCWRPTE